MIPRYARPAMTDIWEPTSKYGIWLEIETLAAEAMEELGQIPSGTSAAVREKGQFEVARIDEIEADVKHDVIGFLSNVEYGIVTEQIAPGEQMMQAGIWRNAFDHGVHGGPKTNCDHRNKQWRRKQTREHGLALGLRFEEGQR